jgi:hypothetical protein
MHALIAGCASPNRHAIQDFVPHSRPYHGKYLPRCFLHSPRHRAGTAAGATLDTVLDLFSPGYAINLIKEVQIHGLFINYGLLYTIHEEPPVPNPIRLEYPGGIPGSPGFARVLKFPELNLKEKIPGSVIGSLQPFTNVERRLEQELPTSFAREQ